MVLVGSLSLVDGLSAGVDSVTRSDTVVDRQSRNSYHYCMKAIVSEKGQVTIPKPYRDQLGIRPGTVKIHLKHIFEKTGIRGRYGLALSGLKEKGMLALPAM